MSISFPVEVQALRVNQPLGTFFVAVLPAELLLIVAESDVMSAHYDEKALGYRLEGTQRLPQEKRLTQIADYIDRTDSAFPNSIILAANYNRSIGIDQDEAIDIGLSSDNDEIEEIALEGLEWTVREDERGSFWITIPSSKKLAAIIDGQHRLFAFTKVKKSESLGIEMLCSIYIDLPKPFQAQLFATINSTQKPVDRSLTYELFGYNVAEEKESLWTPDKLAVFLTRKLGTDPETPMLGKITVAPKMDQALKDLAAGAPWKVSTAVIVDGILRLISTNPKRDSNRMRSAQFGARESLRTIKDRAPLRGVFIEGNDLLIYTMVKNYVIACQEIFWTPARPESFILKTVGIQALFDILRKLASEAVELKDIRADYFVNKLVAARDIDFADAEFKISAGSGRSRIRRALEARLGL